MPTTMYQRQTKVIPSIYATDAKNMRALGVPLSGAKIQSLKETGFGNTMKNSSSCGGHLMKRFCRGVGNTEWTYEGRPSHPDAVNITNQDTKGVLHIHLNSMNANYN
ncbi:hypothetical protein H0G86_005595 [Trichoderma simmonsii]|uniref:Uncharacterized protein n=1 Tax=Trichoderma simmonsii TaxID=1491479 RepID=A0A8G0PFA8_9HYPO|nr:hypothetical protein H0G86_005595 [Trichoderma simmonsii]